MSLLLALVMTCIIGISGVNMDRQPLDPAAFERLSQPERLECVLALLKCRENELHNFSYVAVENVVVSKPGPSTQPFQQETRVTLERCGIRTRLHTHIWSNGKDIVEHWTAWDGKTQRQRGTRPQLSREFGSIKDSEDKWIRQFYFNDALGFRCIDSDRSITRSEWLTDQISVRKYQVEIGLDGSKGAEFIHMNVVMSKTRHHEFWLDPQRDFMIVKEEYLSTHPDGDASTRHCKVVDMMDVDGLWVPTKVVEERSVKSFLGIARYSYEVSRFERNKVKPDDLTVDFKPGTEVVDSIEMTAYVVTPDGGKRFISLFNPQTGLSTVGKETPKEIFAAAHDPFPEARSRRGMWVAIAAGMVLLVSAIIWFARRQSAPSA